MPRKIYGGPTARQLNLTARPLALVLILNLIPGASPRARKTIRPSALESCEPMRLRFFGHAVCSRAFRLFWNRNQRPKPLLPTCFPLRRARTPFLFRSKLRCRDVVLRVQQVGDHKPRRSTTLASVGPEYNRQPERHTNDKAVPQSTVEQQVVPLIPVAVETVQAKPFASTFGWATCFRA